MNLPKVDETALRELLHELAPLIGPIERRWGHAGTEEDATELTDREVTVIRLAMDGHTHQDAADLLGISIKAVEAHRAHVAVKLNLSTRNSLRMLLALYWRKVGREEAA